MRNVAAVRVSAVSLCAVLAMWHLGRTPSAAGRIAQARSTTPTFNREVAPILFTHCVGCHRPDGAGPMSLLTFDGARAYATRIRQKVTTNEMPPWYADRRYGQFRNARGLTPTQIDTLGRGWRTGR